MFKSYRHVHIQYVLFEIPAFKLEVPMDCVHYVLAFSQLRYGSMSSCYPVLTCAAGVECLFFCQLFVCLSITFGLFVCSGHSLGLIVHSTGRSCEKESSL